MTAAEPLAPSPRPTARAVLNKVPEVTLWFWIIKICATTIGETGADYLNVDLGFGLTGTTAVAGALLALLLAVQFRVRRYVPTIYWAAVLLISVVGTLVTDTMTDSLGVPLVVSTVGFSIALAATLAAWWARERTVSIHAITTGRREAFSWLAILFTFALGTAAGDLVSEQLGLGYAVSAVLFGGLIAVVAALRLGTGASAVGSFWAAYILTRPLGASIGDLLSQAKTDGGLGFGTTHASELFLALIVASVAYLTVSRRDQAPPLTPGGSGAAGSAL